MNFELEKKIIIAAFAIFLFLFGSVAIFYFVERGSGQRITKNDLAAASMSAQISQNQKVLESGKDENEVRILFGGDMMFDRYIRSVAKEKGFSYLVEDLSDVMNGADFVVANLEGPITSSDSVSQGTEMGTKENYVFTFPEGTEKDLLKNNISVVNIGNNHIFNFGKDGALQTKERLGNAGVKYFGDPVDPWYRWYVKEAKGAKIGFVSFNEFSAGALENALMDIELASKFSDTIVVYAHWGVEYEQDQGQGQVQIAHQLIDQGADLIIGSHPHVVQGTEIYKNKKIYYSLGNFIFDQYFEEETKNGLLVEVRYDLENDRFEFEDIPVELSSDGKTKLLKK